MSNYGRPGRKDRSIAAAGVRAFTVVAMASVICGGVGAVGTRHDATEAALERCLGLPANASTAGQTDCETVAGRAYDKRMNAAYVTLMRRLPAGAADRLRRSQRTWVVFRDAEATTRSAIYATRRGTMYVPMEADDTVTLVGDRARLLERYARALNIE